MSNSYNKFADYYDRLTENVNYKVRSDYISDFFKTYHKNEGLMLDLACGTGEFTAHFSEKGYTVTGIDLSEEMLTVASAKVSSDVRLLKGDIRQFTLNEKYDICISMLDSINHLNCKEDWINCFQSVYRALKDDGLFIFDVNTLYKHNVILADNAFIFDEEDFFLAWDNELLEDGKVRILLDFFIDNGINYDRYSEEFTEIAFSSNEIKEMLSDYFEVLGVYDDLSLNDETETSERLYFICKRK